MFATLVLLGSMLGSPGESFADRFVHPCTRNDRGYESSSAFTGHADDTNVIFWANGTRGLLQSRDRGLTWTPMTPPHMCIKPVERFLTPLISQAELWCVAGELDDVDPTFVCSGNQGLTFDIAPSPTYGTHRFEALVADATDPTKMVARTRSGPGRRAQLLQSHDAGQSWQPLSIPGVNPRDVDLRSLRADGILFAELCGYRPTGEICGIAKLNPEGPVYFEYLTGPWKETEEVLFSADPKKPAHWLVSMYVESSATMFLIETFDDGATFTRTQTSLVAGWSGLKFLADGGLAYIGVDTDVDGRGADDSVVVIRHGKNGPLRVSPALPGAYMGRLTAAGNTVFVETFDEDAGNVFVLDESQGSQNMTWRTLNAENRP